MMTGLTYELAHNPAVDPTAKAAKPAAQPEGRNAALRDPEAKPFRDPSLGEDGDHTDRISTRFPQLASSTEDPIAGRLAIDTQAMKQTPAAFAHNASQLKDYLNFPKSERVRTPDKVVEAFKAQLKDNLTWLYHQVPPEIREQSKRWYDGARNIAEQWSDKYGVEPRSVAAVLAALSPQKDWFQNVSLAERVLDTWTHAQDRPWTPEMTATADRIFPREKYGPLRDRVDGKALKDLHAGTGGIANDDDAAMWVRTFDQTYNKPGYRLVSPEGEFVGKPQGNVAWGSGVEIGKAIRALRDPSYASISQAMGVRHKVRNFFNNILAPNARHGDVTIDTHAVAAALLRALSGNTVEVAHNFGNNLPKGKQPADWRAAKAAGVSGASGTYGIYADAYREAAHELGILPRELQSITWEAVRGLFPAKFKQAKNVAAVDAIWDQYRNGKLTLDETRNQISVLAGGITPPSWYRPAGRPAAKAEGSSYEGELSGLRLPAERARSGDVGRGSRVDAAGRAAGAGLKAAAPERASGGRVSKVELPKDLPRRNPVSHALELAKGLLRRAG
jgi:hypothetical protein